MAQFLKVLNKAKIACKNSGLNVDEQLVEVNKLSKRNNNANVVHYEVSKKVRKAIQDIGGMMPEEMPTPRKNLKELEKERKKISNEG